ncbi:unnamed protein product, partial [Rotaria socialis]
MKHTRVQIGLCELIYTTKNNLPLIAHEKVYECHIAVGHSGRDKTWAEIKTRYAGIPQQAISIFINMCDVCQTRRSFPKATSGKPIISIGFLTRLQVDLVDMRIYYYIFIKANIILDLKLNWPDLIIINGRPRHPQSQGLVERANAVVQKMLGKWLETNKSLDWPQGFVQKQTPYEMVFGQSVRNDHDFWLQLHQQSINKTIVDEEELPESLADNLNLNDHSLIDNNSEYADACSPIPILSTNTYVLQNDNNDTQTSHKRIREEAEKNYIRTTETMVCASEIVSCVMNMVIYPLEMVINRPDKMKNVCLADFALLYNVSKKKADNARITENSDDEDIIDNAIDEKTIALKMKNGKDPENYYREQLILFLPWSNEEENLININHEETFELYKNLIQQKRSEYVHREANQFEQAFEDHTERENENDIDDKNIEYDEDKNEFLIYE